MCEHTFIFTNYSQVCTICGEEERIIFLDKYNPFSAPICKGYERVVRFRQKVDKLIFLFNPPPHKSPVWKFLETAAPLQGPADIRRALRKYKGKNKYYDSIRLFTRTFTPFRVKLTRDGLKLTNRLTMFFDTVLRCWKHHNFSVDYEASLAGTETNRVPFFSYDYLLRHFLSILKSPLVAYCKPITCKVRHERNNQRLCIILAAVDDETYCQMLGVDRSQNDSLRVTNLPYLQM